MKTTSVFDKKFSITKSTEYTLSIQISLDGFSFLVQDILSEKYIGIKHFAFTDSLHSDDFSRELDKLLKKEPLAEAQYSKVKVVYWTPKVTLIPTPLFDTEKLKSYFELNISLDDNESIYYRCLKNIGSYILYAIPSDISTIIGQYFPYVHFYCQSLPIIESAIMLQKSGKVGNRIHLQVCRSFFDITLVSNGRLLFQNSFKYNNPADFTYFILNIFEQFKINPESTTVLLSGEISKLDERYFGISRYIRDIRFAEHHSEDTFSHAFTDKDLYKYTALIELSQCE